MQLVWQPYLSKTRLLCVRNSRGSLNKHTWHSGGSCVFAQEPLYLVGGSDSLRHLGGGAEGRTQFAPGPESLEVAVAGGSLTENRAPAASPPLPADAGRRGSGALGHCLPALKGEAGTDVSLNQKITLAPRWARVVGVRPHNFVPKVCLSGEQQG